MILIHEIQTIVIMPPRTGSGSLKRIIRDHYPGALHLYRHMEADGVPQGYDRWRKVGVLREPVARMWSLYKFLQRIDGQHDPEFIDAMRHSVDRPFCDWLTQNETTFTDPYSRQDGLVNHAYYSCRHPMPENRKSQWVYLRPDLGTEVYRYDRLDSLATALGIPTDAMRSHQENKSKREPLPHLTPPAYDHMTRFFGWDTEFYHHEAAA